MPRGKSIHEPRAESGRPEGVPRGQALLERCRSVRTLEIAFLLACLVWLYLVLFIPPFTPIHLAGDGPIYLNDAKRMLAGEVLYRDFFQFSTPGTDLVYYALFKLWGPRLWLPNAVLLMVGLAFVWLSVLISKRLMSPRLALLPGAALLTIGFGTHLEPTHHWFSGLAVVAAIAVLIDRQTVARIAAAGALCGVALCFTQFRGLMALLGFAVFVFWSWRRKKAGRPALLKSLALLFGAFLAAVVAVNAYFLWEAGVQQFLYCTVIFGTKYYSAQASYNTLRAFTEPLPAIPPWGNLLLANSWFFIFSFIPLIYILFFARYGREARRRPLVPWARLMLLGIVGLFLFLSIAPAPSLLRTYAGALPGLILLGWFLDCPDRLNRTLVGLLTLVIVLAAVKGIQRSQFAWRGILHTSQGSMAILDPQAYQEYRWLNEHTKPQEYVFDSARGQVYFYLDLRNPARVPFITNTDYTRPEQVADVLQGFKTHKVRYVLWEADVLGPAPSERNPGGDHLEPLRAYLRSRYHVVKAFGGYQLIWEKKE